MKKFTYILLSVIFVLSILSCSTFKKNDETTQSKITFPKIDRHPSVANYCKLKKITNIPKYDPKNENAFQIDFRFNDLSQVNLRSRSNDLVYSDYSTLTKWPKASKLPASFNPDKLLEKNKNPGLNVKKLHALNIDGRGVGLAIIDQVLLTEHETIKDQLRLYEEIDSSVNASTQMHGNAVSSLAVGKDIGVAPKADLYFIAAPLIRFAPECGKRPRPENCLTYIYYAKAIQRILEINKSLPKENKIRVISISRGFVNTDNGYNEIISAINEAKAQNVFVISTSLNSPLEYGFEFSGLGREPNSDPELASSYRPGLFWENYYKGSFAKPTVLFPMDSRTYASSCGINQYETGRNGGYSWTIPYVAGLYALSVQVNPEITPQKFWEAALATGTKIEYQKNGKAMSLEKIVNPYDLIMKVKK